MRNPPRRRFGLGSVLLAASLMVMGSLPLPNPAQATTKPRLVQRRYLRVTSGSSASVKLLRPTTAGNLIVAYVVWDNNGSVSLTDSKGYAYASAVGPTQSSGDSTNAEIFYAQLVVGGTDTVTASFATAITTRGVLYVYEYSGIDWLTPFEAAVAASGSSSSMDSGVLTTAAVNSLLFTGGASNKLVTRAGQGYRTLSRTYGNLIADRVTAPAGSYNATGTQIGTSWIMQLAAFQAIGNDTAVPSVPTNLQASNVVSNAATIAWTASADDTGVAGYKVFRNRIQIATTTQTSYTDLGLAPLKTYSYAVAAYDGAGHVSARSTPALSVTTPSNPPPNTNTAYPLKVSANGRYLVDQNNVPVLLTGDSPQALTVNLSEAEADAFFADRQAAGFNVVWVNLLCATYTGGRADGSTYDGIVPFTTPNDLAMPNEAFFARVDHMLTLAAQHGLTVLLDPAETGSYLSVLSANGVTKARTYGRYLGTRYRSVDNIIWMSGNDFQSWQSPGDDAVVQAVARGIHDTDDRHIHTVELDYLVSGSLDDASWAPLIQLNASYTYYPTYAQVLADYNRANALPTFLVEANYEFEHNAAD
ncbi:MAG: DUF4038 domain-containing protein, partial [Deltaproteobacteria bacterium]|nr:DUF4038 domain-containing protein [Deltaproteobacteria bacterium]